MEQPQHEEVISKWTWIVWLNKVKATATFLMYISLGKMKAYSGNIVNCFVPWLCWTLDWTWVHWSLFVFLFEQIIQSFYKNHTTCVWRGKNTTKTTTSGYAEQCWVMKQFTVQVFDYSRTNTNEWKKFFYKDYLSSLIDKLRYPQLYNAICL